jgi:hypothetical protein
MVLAMEAPEVTTRGGKGERGRPGKEVKDGLLFNRIYIEGDGSSIDEGVEFSFLILPYSAESSF